MIKFTTTKTAKTPLQQQKQQLTQNTPNDKVHNNKKQQKLHNNNNKNNLHKTLRMIKFSVGVDDLGLGLEAVVATGTAHAIHVHNAEKNPKLKFNFKVYW
jgi:hypothetical protein